MSRKKLLHKLRRARHDIDQAAAEVAREEGYDVVDEEAAEEIDMAVARLRALEFRVDAIEAGA